MNKTESLLAVRYTRLKQLTIDDWRKIAMTLAEYIIASNEDEITVTDEHYDMETYFYPFDSYDRWNRLMQKFSEMLTVKEINHGTVVVNISEVINNKMESLKQADLFMRCSLDVVMSSIEEILAGNVSEKWFEKFVNAMEE